MTRTAVDSSVIVAGLLAWHAAHEAAHRALVRSVAGRRDRIVVPAPALVESYAVMTRLPAPHRLAADDAMQLLSGSFEQRATIVGLEADRYWEWLRETAERGIVGGRTYDALILRCAREASARRLLTLDRRDFLRLDPGPVEIVVPG